jgi:predicted O-methyltransferase YrrM
MGFSRTNNYIKYRIKGKSEFDLHSPFMYDFATQVLYETTEYYSYKLLESIRNKYSLDSTLIEIQDFGAGSKIFKDNQRRIQDICKHSVKPAKYGQLLFRIVNKYNPKTTLELGTSLGISTCYLSAANRKGKVITIEADPTIHQIAKQTFKLARAKNISPIVGTFEDQLVSVLAENPLLDLVFIDGNHQKEPTLAYFNQCLANSSDQTIFVFDDINWSEPMRQAWKEIKAHAQVTVSIDLYAMGIIFLRKELSKQDFILKY